MKKYFKGIFVLLLLFIFMPFINVKAVSFDDTLDPVLDVRVREDGVVSWTASLYAYGVWIQSDSDADYYTALINAVNPDKPSINLMELIDGKCPNSSYGCELSKEGTYKVLIQESSPTAGVKKHNSEFTVTYKDGKLSGITVEYVVTFDTNGGSEVANQWVKSGEKAILPETPTKDGYKFVKWYKDAALTEEYVFDTVIDSNITLYAKWNQILTSAGAHITKPVRGSVAPTDITSDDESKYTVKVDYWYLFDKGAGYPHLTEGDILEPGKTYSLRFFFIPKEGYVFEDYPVTTLNGNETKKYAVRGYCEYKFFVSDQLNQISASTSSVKLEWEKNTEAKGYIVQVKSGKKWKTVKTITKNKTTSLTIKKLKAGTKYTYRVQAYKIVKKKKKVINTTNNLVAITTPKNPKVTVSIKDYNAMNIKINSVKGAYSYTLENSLDGKEYKRIDVLYEPTTISQESLEIGKTYYYRVRVCNKNGYCSKWIVVSKKQTTLAPKLSLATESKKVTVTVTAVNGADGYEVYRKSSPVRWRA